MPEVVDPTFYRSPSAAMAAPPETLAYVAAYDPAGTQRDHIEAEPELIAAATGLHPGGLD